MAMSRTADKTRAKGEEVLSELEMRQRIDDLKAELAAISRTLSALGGQKVDDYRESVERLVSDAVSASHKAFDTARSEALWRKGSNARFANILFALSGSPPASVFCSLS